MVESRQVYHMPIVKSIATMGQQGCLQILSISTYFYTDDGCHEGIPPWTVEDCLRQTTHISSLGFYKILLQFVVSAFAIILLTVITQVVAINLGHNPRYRFMGLKEKKNTCSQVTSKLTSKCDWLNYKVSAIATTKPNPTLLSTCTTVHTFECSKKLC